MKRRKWLCLVLIVCMFAECRFAVHAETEEKDKDVTLAPYFFIQDGDPSVDSFPLKGTEVETNINGTIAETYVTQTYENEGERPLSASYVFPASTKVSVHGMTMQIGDQKITAVIKEKEEAKADFEEAKTEGKSASLLEEKRSNVFTMDVANIMPGDTVSIELHYTELLETSEGTCQFVFPTVVGPRYGGGMDEAEAEEGSWIASPYLPEGVSPDSAYDITVSLSTGVPISDLVCKTHETDVEWKKNSEARITLKDAEDFAGDRDYILEYQMTGEEVGSGLILYEGEEENYFLLTVQPPKRYEPDEILPREYLFVLDVSGSMNGYPLDTAKGLIRNMVGGLRSTDCFNLFLFSDIVSEMSLESVEATEDNMQCALDLIDQQEGGGGTELALALKDALQTPAKKGVSRNVVVITDGYIWDEDEVFELIKDTSGGETSFFSFGIGSSVNRSLMEGIAGAGMGEAFVVTEEEEAEATAERFRTYIEAPLLTDIQVSFDGFDAYEVGPSNLPTLFAQKPVVLLGKWRGEPEGSIYVRGKTGAEDYEERVQVSDAVPSEDKEAIRYQWARKKVEELTSYGFASVDDQTKEEITTIGLSHSMLTPYTSFVAVLDTVRNPQGESAEVDQPSPLPRGVSGLSVGGYLVGTEPEEAMLFGMMVLILAAGLLNRRKRKRSL